MSILSRAELLLQAKNYSGSGDWLDESGNGHDAQLGSTSGDDTNDPVFLPYAGDKYVKFPGANDNYLSLADSAALDITGDIDIRAKVSEPFSTSTATVVGKWDSGLTKSYYFGFSSGALMLDWSEDTSTSAGPITSTVDVSTVFSDDEVGWIRATLDVDNGASGHDVTFYTSVDGASWDQLGDVVTTGGVTSIGADTSVLILGALRATLNKMSGGLYEVQIYDGIDGTLALDVNLADVAEPYAAFTERSSNAATVTINRASSGYVSTVVDRDMFVLSTDDYFEVADHADLDFAASDPLTVVVLGATTDISTTQRLLSKRSANGGYEVYYDGSAASGLIGDSGASTTQVSTTAPTNNVLQTVTLVAVRNDANGFGVSLGGETPNKKSSVGIDDMSTATTLDIGRYSGIGTSYLDGQIIAVALFREALTDEEIAAVSEALLGNVRRGLSLAGLGQVLQTG